MLRSFFLFLALLAIAATAGAQNPPAALRNETMWSNLDTIDGLIAVTAAEQCWIMPAPLDDDYAKIRRENAKFHIVVSLRPFEKDDPLVLFGSLKKERGVVQVIALEAVVNKVYVQYQRNRLTFNGVPPPDNMPDAARKNILLAGAELLTRFALIIIQNGDAVQCAKLENKNDTALANKHIAMALQELRSALDGVQVRPRCWVYTTKFDVREVKVVQTGTVMSIALYEQSRFNRYPAQQYAVQLDTRTAPVHIQKAAMHRGNVSVMYKDEEMTITVSAGRTSIFRIVPKQKVAQLARSLVRRTVVPASRIAKSGRQMTSCR